MYNRFKESLSLLLEVPGVFAVVLSNRDGIVVEYVSNGTHTNSNVIGAMSAGIFGMIKKSLQRISEGDDILGGELNQVLVELTDSKLMAVTVTDGILMSISKGDVNLGLLRIYTKKASDRISEIMNSI